MLLNSLGSLVREQVPEHLRGLWTPDGETQLNFADKENNIRIPKDGNGSPRFDDTAYHPPLSTLQALGVSGWNYVDGRSVFTAIDLDGLDHTAGGHDQHTLDDLVARLSLIPQVEIIRSKGGEGIHARVYFDPERQPFARTREAHIANGQRVLTWLASRIGSDLKEKVDCCGVITWIFHVDRKPAGFTIIKPSTAFMPDGWEQEFPMHVKTGDYAEPSHESHPQTPKHKALIDYLTTRGEGEFKDGRLTTHTFNLLLASQDKALKVVGSFATTASGKDCPADRNCFAYPDADGSWRVYRFGKNAAEHESWWKSSSGYTTTWFNRGRKSKAVDPETLLVSIAEADEHFHDQNGRTYVTTTIHGVKETLPHSEARYRAKLRLAYTDKTGSIASGDTLKTALGQLEAVALLERPEYPVAIRIAEHGGRLYVDLGDRERQIIEVWEGWRIVKEAPVRFLRPFGMLPLPTPLAGGSLQELQQFINVDADDLPLLLAFVVGCFHPSGPYSLLQLVGEQGSAKSSLMRFIHDFVDPQLAVGSTLPRDEKDFLVAAQLRWLLSFDNVDDLNRKISSLLCMVITGAASANRKLFTDSDQSILKAKRPAIITAIGNVVTASDLLDRTLTLVLPPIPTEARKSEFALAQELRRDGVRGRILGYILDGVAAALAGHASIKRDDMPRLADLFSWATAAESGLGIKPGSAIEAVKGQAADESQHVAETQFGREIVKLCRTGWKGSAKELASAIDYGISARDISGQLREIAPDLRRNGHLVVFRRSNGARVIELSAA